MRSLADGRHSRRWHWALAHWLLRTCGLRRRARPRAPLGRGRAKAHCVDFPKKVDSSTEGGLVDVGTVYKNCPRSSMSEGAPGKGTAVPMDIVEERNPQRRSTMVEYRA